ncbi:hypothetical protein ABZ815_37815 [Nonomuraea sp. NPDC047529]|uniref:hypothetical protein n=1 Tax=Nonomuraea sp. NPDC047529 TaxID=3155623 RepID=UPI0033CF6DC3
MRFLRLLPLGVVMPVGWTSPSYAGDQELIDGSSVETITLLTDRYSVDDPVVQVLPEFKMADPRYTKITHRAGSSRPHETRSS